MIWEDHALCKGKHLDLWYPPLEEQGHHRYYDIAKWVCDHCPVQGQCRKAGADEEFGCWGGQTPKERRKGVYRPPRKYLPAEYLDLIPNASETPLDIEYLRITLSQYAKRRTSTVIELE